MKPANEHDDAARQPTKSQERRVAASFDEQLASQAAEIERLKCIIAKHDLCHDLHGKVGQEHFEEGCRRETIKEFGSCGWADRIDTLESELAATKAEVERLRAIVLRAYPHYPQQSGVCSRHRDGNPDCHICFPNWRTNAEHHREVGDALIAERDAEIERLACEVETHRESRTRLGEWIASHWNEVNELRDKLIREKIATGEAPPLLEALQGIAGMVQDYAAPLTPRMVNAQKLHIEILESELTAAKAEVERLTDELAEWKQLGKAASLTFAQESSKDKAARNDAINRVQQLESELTALRVEVANHFCDVRKILKWLPTNKPAVMSFTSGPEREVADYIEQLRFEAKVAKEQADG